ncbi:protein-glutamate O-methyltransferase CheR [Ectothiorhodospiraceae bacterium BW-2]|nr:protein-glutamate O-methyltransferase CheR [Ectothiorhodospiraceae bacterium BW-2]
MTQPRLPAELYDRFRQFLQQASGIVLGDNKHYLVTSRLGRLMREYGIEDFAQLLDQLQFNRNPKLRAQVIDAMTTNETLWFRDRYPFELLKEQILPEISQRKPTSLRIWSAASSSGQESYSISMTIAEYLATRPHSLPANIQIIGTDISTKMLATAQKGIYDQLALNRGISEQRLQRFFLHHSSGGWEVKPEIKNRVSFREMNLANNFASLGRFDIIFCRNVLIYFSSELKGDILNRLAAVLNPGGYLILGGSESPSSYSHKFEMIRFAQGVAYRLAEQSATPSQQGGGVSRPPPPPPLRSSVATPLYSNRAPKK